jgi:hypothetical protein
MVDNSSRSQGPFAPLQRGDCTEQRAARKAGASVGPIPEHVSVVERATVMAGLAKAAEAVNQ